jgi:hypothetical protein
MFKRFGDRSEGAGSALDEVPDSLWHLLLRHSEQIDQGEGAAQLAYLAGEATWIGAVILPRQDGIRRFRVETIRDIQVDELPSIQFGRVHEVDLVTNDTIEARLVGAYSGMGDEPVDDRRTQGLVALHISMAAHAQTDNLGELTPDERNVAAETAALLQTPILQALAFEMLAAAGARPEA